jgi:hypothetical protein
LVTKSIFIAIDIIDIEFSRLSERYGDRTHLDAL